MLERVGRLERGLSLIVGLAAIAAALAALYQTALARRQARAAAWPYLSQANSLTLGHPYTRTLANQGVGPARVRHVRVDVDGKAVATWDAAVAHLTGAAPGPYEFSWIGAGSVLSPGTVDTLLTLPAGPTAVGFWRAAAQRLTVEVCYCSVYDECWVTSLSSEPNVAIIGLHAIIYSKAADADRAFLRDVLGFPSVDAGHGWLIFAAPPAEIAVHPAESDGYHELYLMCADIEATVADLRSRGVQMREIQDRPWGRLTQVPLPSGEELGLYEPRHPTAIGTGR
jgi:catechol 2,3-dioxygenase-like lactoylglutathione lyase family enzyme